MRGGCGDRNDPQHDASAAVGLVQTQFRVGEAGCGIDFDDRISQARHMVRQAMALVYLALTLVGPMALAREAHYNPLDDRHLPVATPGQVARADAFAAASRNRVATHVRLVDRTFDIPAHYGADTVLWQDAATPSGSHYFVGFGYRGYDRQYSPYPWAERIRKEFAQFTGTSEPTHRHHSSGHSP